jgi:2,4-dienoyl-CoA reductase-like NADH-dependent reductase (Old Yellow Enzyme family)
MVTFAGEVTDALVDCYTTLARGEIGLIITGHAFVHPLGKGSPMQLAIHDDRMIPGLKRLAAAVHAEGGRVAVQITHAGRQTRREIIGATPVAPSVVSWGVPEVVPRELSEPEIEGIVEFFGKAAGRARDAGFDAVELHGAHGYLISQFLSPLTNKRDDSWGGDHDTRFTFLSRVHERVRREVGPDFPLFIKLAMQDGVEGGLTIEESVSFGEKLARLGIDAIETSGGYSTSSMNIRRDVLPGKGEAYFRHHASALKKKVNVPVILVGGLRSLDMMESVVSSGDADFIALSRPFIREPDLIRKLRDGAATAACISCNKCSVSREPELKCLAS